MDWLQFFSSVVGSLAWPAAVVALACLARAPLAKLIPRLRSVKYGELHLDIAEELERVKDQVDANSETPNALIEEPPISFRSLAQADPRAAILSAWLPVEIELNEIAAKSGLKIQPGMPALRQLRPLREQGILDQLTIQTLANLRRIRNTAVHVTEESVNFNDAMNMAEMCQWVSAQLKRINASLEAHAPAPE
ncbi:hypothetical protein [Pseudomonas sp. NFPP07]|uniref:hypothetical protein n=1 Tax=Pseudomonas sp. NFPP07 TaxID=1566213 RepID=UPI001587DBBA|nr:hypothetical protein [Pseudomonas sp. NFPP07]